MISKKTSNNQLSFLAPTLAEQLNPKQELYLLANQIDWKYFEIEFSEYYSDKGRPAHPIRLMVSLLILKSVYNLSDEKLVEEHWIMNPYFQYFSGFDQMQWEQPCAASDLVHFRNRIGEEGVEKIFKNSIDIHGDDSHDKHVSIDTTAAEKNITYPTDSKLAKKIIDKCVKISKNEGITLRMTYAKETKNLMKNVYNAGHPKRRKKANRARKRLKTIAGILIRELYRKLPQDRLEFYISDLELFKKILSQKRYTKNKIYSLHEPNVYAMSKGKAHKKYEYGVKGSIVLTQKTGIIVGAMTFKTNVYDGHTLETVLKQTKKLIGKSPKTASVDRGYKGKKMVESTQINIPGPPLKRDTNYAKRKKRNHFKRRAGIEPVIGHVKQDHRVNLNYLKGQIGDSINFIMGATGFNYRKMMKKLKAKAFWLYIQINELLKPKNFHLDYISNRYNMIMLNLF